MRYKFIKIFYLLAFLLITLRLFYWQIIQSDDLTARGEGQRILSKDIRGLRGEVVFADGTMAASNKPTYLLYIEPQKIKKNKSFTDDQLVIYLKQVSRKLASLIWPEQNKELIIEEQSQQEQIDLFTESMFKKINPALQWVSLNERVDSNLKNRLEDLKIEGLGFEQNSDRFYPEGSSSAHLLGFLASDLYGLEKGYFGLEGFYDGELKGKKGLFSQEKDALGLPIVIGKFLSKEPKNGKTLVLNIDRTVQYTLEDKLKKGIEKYKAKGASGVIIEPKTGKILAMASYPNYNPENPEKFPKEFYRNPITADGYEPGSTFKVLVMAAGINEEAVKPDTVCDICEGPINLGGFTIRTWDNKYRPKATMTDVIIHSDNTGMVFMAKKLGFEKLYTYIRKFGFGDLTGVDLQDENSPALREKEEWKEIDLATASFGQGISVTALQVARAVAAIANGGNLMEPQVVGSIKEGDKTTKINPRIIEKVIKDETAKTITEIMVNAVDLGEAQYYKKVSGVLNFKIAGKTGTAQIPVAGHYDPNKTIASFVGFAPADNPKFVMLIRYDQPTTSIYGADTAAPTFFEVAKELFLYYGIPPSE